MMNPCLARPTVGAPLAARVSVMFWVTAAEGSQSFKSSGSHISLFALSLYTETR